eukprot:scaffold2248_cov136-Skeletonema_dohrnii-CCMP3373.AAC.19
MGDEDATSNVKSIYASAADILTPAKRDIGEKKLLDIAGKQTMKDSGGQKQQRLNRKYHPPPHSQQKQLKSNLFFINMLLYPTRSRYLSTTSSAAFNRRRDQQYSTVDSVPSGSRRSTSQALNMATNQPNIEEISLESIDQCSDISTLSDIFGKLENAKREEDRAAKKKERAAKEDALRRMRITADEEKELANPNSEKECVKNYQARERRLLESGVTKETLDSLVAYYNSILDSDEPFCVDEDEMA